MSVTREQAHANARAVLDRARHRRDSMPVRGAAEAAAEGSDLTADEIEALIHGLRASATPGRTAA